MTDENTFRKRYETGLNENQKTAVESVSGSVLLLAVPGSGKTTVLVRRLGYMILVCGIPAEKILTITYTVAATVDMRERFHTVFFCEATGEPEFRTINGLSAKIIAKYGAMIGKDPFELADDEKLLTAVVSRSIEKHTGEYPTDAEVGSYRKWITYAKNMMLSEDEIRKLGAKESIKLSEVYRDYNTFLKERGLMDYDDQMVYAYRLLVSVPELLTFFRQMYPYICVDEAQDTSKIQHEIIKCLAGEKGNLFMVGDEDQSIYGFRAAYPQALLSFSKDHPGAQILFMDQNYRSTGTIVTSADRVIRKNVNRYDKKMKAVREEGTSVKYIRVSARRAQLDAILRAARQAEDKTAVLYRDNESAIPLVDLLEREGIPFYMRTADLSFFTGRVVTDITGFLHFAGVPQDAELFSKMYYKCSSYIAKRELPLLSKISKERGISLLEAVEFLPGVKQGVLMRSRELRKLFHNLTKERPTRALDLIMDEMGYEDYLKRTKIDAGAVYVLREIAGREKTVTGFLGRLAYLRDMLRSDKRNPDANLVLSTIHSAKGLEFDSVYLLDIYDGLFPANVKDMTKEEEEEERRLFYVGVTRAKEQLSTFVIEGLPSMFVSELGGPSGKSVPYRTKKKSLPDVRVELGRGDRVRQTKYGVGTVTSVKKKHGTFVTGFVVRFDSGVEKEFSFPLAFQKGMRLIDD